MPSLIIRNNGGLGDTGYGVSALNILREKYNPIFMCGRKYCQMALENTKLVDKFIIKPDNWKELPEDYRQQWLLKEAQGLRIDTKAEFLPGAYMWHSFEPEFNAPAWWKRAYSNGVNYFDAVAKRIRITAFDSKAGHSKCIQNGVPEAYGERPVTHITHKERLWLRDFRRIHHIPEDALILGWQFVGSSQVKWYPFFDEVIQRGVMQKYPNVYVVALGDLEDTMTWDEKLHHGRYINLGASVSFRQAYLLTSIMDCFVSPETGTFVFSQGFPDVPKVLLATHSAGYHICCGDETAILTPDCDCAPCYNIVASCPNGDKPWSKCMGSIAPEKVIKAIENQLGVV